MKLFSTQILTLLLLTTFSMVAEAQSQRIDRKSLVRRHNPHITDTTNHVFAEKWLLGSGELIFNVDATGLQTFANDEEWPITVGLNFTDTAGIDHLDAKLDRWSGRFDSRFHRNGQRFRVETVCMQAAVATRITSDTIFEISFRSSTGFPVRTAQKSPNFKQIGRRQRMVVKETDGHQTHWLLANWYGDVSVRQDDNRVVLTCKGGPVEVLFRRLNAEPSVEFFEQIYAAPFMDYALNVATEWSLFWNDCGLADFSASDSPEAKLAEQRMVEALYQFASVEIDDWWQLAPLALYGFPSQVATALRMAMKNNSQIYHRPEAIAAAEMILRAYAHPYIAERHIIKPEAIEYNQTTVRNAYSLMVMSVAKHLEENSSLDSLKNDSESALSNYLKREGLLEVAEKWESDGGIASASIFQLPPWSEILAQPASPENDALLLVAIAARHWPSQWKVSVENIVPICEELELRSNGVMELGSKE